MNTTLATTNLSRTRRTTSIHTTRASGHPRHTVRFTDGDPRPERIVSKRPASELTRLVFCALLGIAACLALVGVVDQASTTSPDDPPPPLIVDFD